MTANLHCIKRREEHTNEVRMSHGLDLLARASEVVRRCENSDPSQTNSVLASLLSSSSTKQSKSEN